MAEAAEAAEAVTENTDATIIEAADEAPDAVEIEEKARRLGWRPKEEFKGDETRWVDADTFVKRGEEILPIVQANNKALEKELTALRKEVKRFAEYHSKTEQRAYAAALRDLEARQAEAVEANDAAGVREITREIVELGKEVSAPAPDAERIADWKAENPWFEADEDLNTYATGLRFPADTPLEEQLRLIAEKTRKAFPHKFTNQRRQAAPAVEGASVARRSTAKGWADLPPEAKAFADKMVKQGFLTREQYAKDYFQ